MAREKMIHLQALLTLPDDPVTDEAKAHIAQAQDGEAHIEIFLDRMGEQTLSLSTDLDMEWVYHYADQLEQFFGSIKLELENIAAGRAEERGIDSTDLMPDAPYRGVLRKRND